MLACGRSGFLHEGPLELVGYNTSGGLCTSAEIPNYSIFGSICWPAGVDWHSFWPGPIHIEGMGWSAGGGDPTASQISGELNLNVAAIEIRFHREGKIEKKKATVAQVTGDLLAKLGQTQPFGLFAAILPGCVLPRDVRVVARDSAGEFLGASRGKALIKRGYRHPFGS